MADRADFGKIINERRLALGYSLGQLANRLGTTAAKVRAWERGDNAPGSDQLTALAGELDLDPKILRDALPAPSHKAAPTADVPEATAVVAAHVFSDAADTAAVESDDATPTPPANAPRAAAVEEKAAAGPLGKNDAADVEKDDAADGTRRGAAHDPDVGAAEESAARAAVEGEEDAPGAEEPTAAVIAIDEAGIAAAEAPGGDDAAADADPDAGVAASLTEPAGDGDDDGSRIEDLPTEAVPVIVSREPSIGVGTAVAEAPPRTSVATTSVPPPTGFFAPVEQFFNTIFDPNHRYLFWIRTILTVVVLLVFLRVLAWAVPAFFDALKEILDTIESTPNEVDPNSVIEGLRG